MSAEKPLTVFIDFKSPYAYLAEAAAHEIEVDSGLVVERMPYTLQIDKYLGEARLDESGQDQIGTRNDHQWRRVRYSYMDCRREANRLGLTVRGPRKIFDSRPAHVAFLYAVAENNEQARVLHATIFERFWRRELDLEDSTALAGVLTECGIDPAGFEQFLNGEGMQQLDAIQLAAEDAGVFGVPSWLVDDELFWGAERFTRVREKRGLSPSQ